MSEVKGKTQVTSPPAARFATPAAAVRCVHVNPDVRSQRAYREEQLRRSAGSVGRVLRELPAKTRRTAKKGIDDVQMTPFLRKVSLFSSGGSFLDGYVLSLIGVALTQIVPMMSLTAAESAAIGASVMLGIFLGTIFGVYLTDIVGRKKMFTIDIVAIAVFSLASVLATTAWQLVAARFLIGVFVGADYPIATSLIAEFTPKKHRAVSMGLVSAAWYLGATVAAVVGYALYGVEDGWKWMLGSAVVPCAILLIGRHDSPESPLWLASKGRTDEAAAVVARVFGPDVELEPEEVPRKTSLATLLRGGYLKRMFFLGVFILCQVVPMYAI